jgi:hypothetical protein
MVVGVDTSSVDRVMKGFIVGESFRPAELSVGPAIMLNYSPIHTCSIICIQFQIPCTLHY